MAKIVKVVSLTHLQKRLKKVSISFNHLITNRQFNIYSVLKTKTGEVQNGKDRDSPPKKVKKRESISFDRPITDPESHNYPVSGTKSGGVRPGDLSDVDKGCYFA
jgi:hypothetical protein